MTLAPSKFLGPRLRISYATDEYALPTTCEAPGCGDRATEAHHVEPRSRTAGPKLWVEIDGFQIRNRVALCKRHHDDLTGGIGGHRARIVWDGGWAWCVPVPDGKWQMTGLLEAPRDKTDVPDV